MARLAFSCRMPDLRDLARRRASCRGQPESGKQPVLTRLATSGVRAEGGAHPLCCHHPAGLVSGRICI